MRKKWILPIILFLAIFFRFFWLTKSPPSLNWDEVSIGYNAYSILETGKDEWGVRFPLSFKAYGEHKLPGMIYASIPGIAVFGLTEIGVRVTPAIIGVLAVYVMFLLGRELKDEKTGFIASFLMAISPWHVHLSRASFEAGLGLLFLELSVLLFIKAKQNSKLMVWSAISGVLAMYSYNSARIIVPLILLTYLLQNYKIYIKIIKTVVVSSLVAILLLLPLYQISKNPEILTRWNTVSIRSDKGFIDGVGEARRYTPLPDPLPRIIHNKYSHHIHGLFLRYAKTFSTSFLFFEGGTNTQRSVPGVGLMYLFELPLLIIGLTQLKKGKKLAKYMLPLLLIAPIPSAITIDAPDSLRALSTLPALVLITALGAQEALSWAKKRSSIVNLSILLFILWNIGHFSYRLFGVYPVKYSSDWQYGYQEAVEEVMARYDDTDKIYVTTKVGEPYMFFLFYGNIDPEKYQQDPNLQRSQDSVGWTHVNVFDKFEFVDFTSEHYKPGNIIEREDGNLLFVSSFAELPQEVERIKSIQAPNWEVMFEIAEYREST